MRHPAFRALTRTGRGSGRPESYGADFMFYARGGWWGVQRKEIKDFVASVQDGRLATERAQMCMLKQGVLVLEGTPRWTNDGELMGSNFTNQRWTRRTHNSYLMSVQAEGIWVLTSSDTRETADIVLGLQDWVAKEKHTALKMSRAPMAVPFGSKTNRDYQRHVLMGFQGCGVELGERMLDVFGGVPLQWTVTEAQLRGVEGIGPKKAKQWMEVL